MCFLCVPYPHETLPQEIIRLSENGPKIHCFIIMFFKLPSFWGCFSPAENGWHVLALRVADLALQIALFGSVEVQQT